MKLFYNEEAQKLTSSDNKSHGKFATKMKLSKSTKNRVRLRVEEDTEQVSGKGTDNSFSTAFLRAEQAVVAYLRREEIDDTKKRYRHKPRKPVSLLEKSSTFWSIYETHHVNPTFAASFAVVPESFDSLTSQVSYSD